MILINFAFLWEVTPTTSRSQNTIHIYLRYSTLDRLRSKGFGQHRWRHGTATGQTLFFYLFCVLCSLHKNAGQPQQTLSMSQAWESPSSFQLDVLLGLGLARATCSWDLRSRCFCCRIPFHETNEVKGSSSTQSVELTEWWTSQCSNVNDWVALLLTQKSSGCARS